MSEKPGRFISGILIKCQQIVAVLQETGLLSKMRSTSVVFILVVAVAMATASSNDGKVYYNLKDAPALFEQFIKDYNKHYKDIADKYVHFQAFVVTLAEINRLNYENPLTTFGINKFTDYTEEEKKNMMGLATLY